MRTQRVEKPGGCSFELWQHGHHARAGIEAEQDAGWRVTLQQGFDLLRDAVFQQPKTVRGEAGHDATAVVGDPHLHDDRVRRRPEIAGDRSAAFVRRRGHQLAGRSTVRRRRVCSVPSNSDPASHGHSNGRTRAVQAGRPSTKNATSRTGRAGGFTSAANVSGPLRTVPGAGARSTTAGGACALATTASDVRRRGKTVCLVVIVGPALPAEEPKYRLRQGAASSPRHARSTDGRATGRLLPSRPSRPVWPGRASPAWPSGRAGHHIGGRPSP